MKIPATAPHQPRPVPSHRSLTAALRWMSFGLRATVVAATLMGAARAATIEPRGTSIQVRLARVESRHAVVAFITVISPSGMPMEGVIHVVAGEQEVAALPVFSAGSMSMSVPVAKDTARDLAVCVTLEGLLRPGGDRVQPIDARACSVLVEAPGGLLPPERRRPTIPRPGDVLGFDGAVRR